MLAHLGLVVGVGEVGPAARSLARYAQVATFVNARQVPKRRIYDPGYTCLYWTYVCWSVGLYRRLEVGEARDTARAYWCEAEDSRVGTLRRARARRHPPKAPRRFMLHSEVSGRALDPQRSQAGASLALPSSKVERRVRSSRRAVETSSSHIINQLREPIQKGPLLLVERGKRSSRGHRVPARSAELRLVSSCRAVRCARAAGASELANRG